MKRKLFRTLRDYEDLKYFNTFVKNDLNFHLHVVKELCKSIQEIMEITDELIFNLTALLEETYSIEPYNFFAAVQLYFMKKYANFKFKKHAEEKLQYMDIYERLKKIENKIIILNS